MELLKQNNQHLNKEIQKIGCFFRCAQAIAEMKTKTPLSTAQINAMWTWGKKNNHVDENLDMIHGAVPFANKAMAYLQHQGKFVEVGTFKNGRTFFYPSIPKEMRRSDALIQKIRQRPPSNNPYHFRVVNKEGVVIFDPYTPPIKALRIEYSILFAFIK